MSQNHIAYEFRAPCGCLRAAFIDTGYLPRSALAASLGEYLLGPACTETRVVRRELEGGEVVSIGGPCPHEIASVGRPSPDGAVSE